MLAHIPEGNPEAVQWQFATDLNDPQNPGSFDGSDAGHAFSPKEMMDNPAKITLLNRCELFEYKLIFIPTSPCFYEKMYYNSYFYL